MTPSSEFRAHLAVALHDMMEDAGWRVVRTGERPDGLCYVVLSEIGGGKTRLHLGKTTAEAIGWAILDATDLAPAPRSDRMDANRIARTRLNHSLRKLLPSAEDDDL